MVGELVEPSIRTLPFARVLLTHLPRLVVTHARLCQTKHRLVSLPSSPLFLHAKIGLRYRGCALHMGHVCFVMSIFGAKDRVCV